MPSSLAASELILYVIVMKSLIPDGLPFTKLEPRRGNGDSLVISQVGD